MWARRCRPPGRGGFSPRTLPAFSQIPASPGGRSSPDRRAGLPRSAESSARGPLSAPWAAQAAGHGPAAETAPSETALLQDNRAEEAGPGSAPARTGGSGTRPPPGRPGDKRSSLSKGARQRLQIKFSSDQKVRPVLFSASTVNPEILSQTSSALSPPLRRLPVPPVRGRRFSGASSLPFSSRTVLPSPHRRKRPRP
jgi:hypothetical protein